MKIGEIKEITSKDGKKIKIIAVKQHGCANCVFFNSGQCADALCLNEDIIFKKYIDLPRNSKGQFVAKNPAKELSSSKIKDIAWDIVRIYQLNNTSIMVPKLRTIYSSVFQNKLNNSVKKIVDDTIKDLFKDMMKEALKDAKG